MKNSNRSTKVASYKDRAFALAQAQGMYRSRSVPNGKGYNRKVKHKGKDY